MPTSSPSGSDLPAQGLPEVLAPLADDLAQVGEAYREILSGVSDRSREVTDQASRFSGKRLRPALTCAAARIAGSEITPDVATVAAIVELIHTATLIHDDVLDAADVRRKTQTLNSRWGDGLAVLAGDVLFSRAYLAAAGLEDRFASRYLSEVVGEVVDGEIRQDLATRDPELSEADYRRIIHGKTAALYEAALVVGAHYGGALDLVGPLGRYGHHLGMAFQIVDDRLDVTGSEAEMGKTLGRDLGEGKMTLPLILWRDACATEAERVEAVRQIEAAWADPDQGGDLGRQLAEDGALDATDEAAREEVARSAAALESLPPGPDRVLLGTIGAFVLERSV